MTRRQLYHLLAGLCAVVIATVVLLALASGIGAALLALLIIVGLATTLAVWFAPIHLAHRRGAQDLKPIFVFTLLAGWTLIGWLAALIWASRAPTAPEHRVLR
ncbi:superinfection immunity protein [Amycolatopsis thermoflava]|uniref:superinfection immunity protein n=1 Tax=Amycolatopsis thermoflava TaxID=84480 RepID=UPI000429C33D|nr:superinfection immunity protein [Amycolatopsis thermoflava]